MLETPFVADGHQRVREAIRRELLDRYAAQLTTATFLERLRLYLKIERKVARRAEREAPPYALY